MAFDAHKNLASSTVATPPSPPGTGSTLVVAAGQGARFSAAPFDATVWPSAAAPTLANAEIVRVTSVATDTLQIVRAQGGTAARAIGVGDLIAETITAKTLTDIETEFAAYARLTAFNTFTTNQVISGPAPALILTDTNQPANSRLLYWSNDVQQMRLIVADDSYVTQTMPIAATRPGDVKIWRDVYEKQRVTPMGHWQSGGTPTCGGGWSATGMAYSYSLMGKTAVLTFTTLGGTITGSPTSLTISLPSGLTAAQTTVGSIMMNLGGGGWGGGICWVDSGGSVITFSRDLQIAFAAGVLYVYLTITIAIN